MIVNNQQDIVNKVEELLKKGELNDVCFKAGKFIEDTVTNLCIENGVPSPENKNAKEKIDRLIYKHIFSRVLGQKLHVVRELRNAVAHSLQYTVTNHDAYFAVETLNQFIGWLNQDNLMHRWQSIVTKFEEGLNQINEARNVTHLKQGLWLMYTALQQAARLKIESLGISYREDGNFSPGVFSSVDILLQNGIDVRSRAWEKLSYIRNKMTHNYSHKDIGKQAQELRDMVLDVRNNLPELELVFQKLNPLKIKTSVNGHYPQVKVESFFIFRNIV